MEIDFKVCLASKLIIRLISTLYCCTFFFVYQCVSLSLVIKSIFFNVGHQEKNIKESRAILLLEGRTTEKNKKIHLNQIRCTHDLLYLNDAVLIVC